RRRHGGRRLRIRRDIDARAGSHDDDAFQLELTIRGQHETLIDAELTRSCAKTREAIARLYEAEVDAPMNSAAEHRCDVRGSKTVHAANDNCPSVGLEFSNGHFPALLTRNFDLLPANRPTTLRTNGERRMAVRVSAYGTVR